MRLAFPRTTAITSAELGVHMHDAADGSLGRTVWKNILQANSNRNNRSSTMLFFQNTATQTRQEINHYNRFFQNGPSLH